MAKVPIETLSNKEIARVFIAQSVNEADHVEHLLTGKRIQYAKSMEPFIRSPTLFQSERMGVAFYVISGQADFCR